MSVVETMETSLLIEEGTISFNDKFLNQLSLLSTFGIFHPRFKTVHNPLFVNYGDDFSFFFNDVWMYSGKDVDGSIPVFLELPPIGLSYFDISKKNKNVVKYLNGNLDESRRITQISSFENGRSALLIKVVSPVPDFKSFGLYWDDNFLVRLEQVKCCAFFWKTMSKNILLSPIDPLIKFIQYEPVVWTFANEKNTKEMIKNKINNDILFVYRGIIFRTVDNDLIDHKQSLVLKSDLLDYVSIITKPSFVVMSTKSYETKQLSGPRAILESKQFDDVEISYNYLCKHFIILGYKAYRVFPLRVSVISGIDRIYMSRPLYGKRPVVIYKHINDLNRDMEGFYVTSNGFVLLYSYSLF